MHKYNTTQIYTNKQRDTNIIGYMHKAQSFIHNNNNTKHIETNY